MNAQLGQITDSEIHRDQRNQLPLLKSREQKQGTVHSPPHTTSPKEWADHLSQPSGPTPGHTPTLIPYKEPARPPSGSK